MPDRQSAHEDPPTEGARESNSADEVRRIPGESTDFLTSLGPTLPSPDYAREPFLLRQGEVLAGRFVVVGFLARGGMGAVYEAEDGILRTRVALKLIRSDIASDASAMERFRREVLLARQVSHPNVCRVYELYETTTAGGLPIRFLTMELLSGETLSQRLAQAGKLSTDDALPLVRQMCAGLAAAHAEGVVHRDFKTSNLMLVPKTEDGARTGTRSTRVVITDFGVARAFNAGSASPPEAKLTGEAGVLGTPDYMAPEQVTGGEATPASDIYALGVVLYELVTGKLPFTGDTPLASAARRLNEDPPRPELASPGLQPRWSTVILRCLSRDPGRRFQRAQDVARALDVGRTGLRRPAALAAVSLALLVGALAVTRAFHHAARVDVKTPIAVMAPRPVVAIFGFRNQLSFEEQAWLPTALEELLAQELEAAESSLRLIPTDRVAEARRSLGISPNSLPDEAARRRLTILLVPNYYLYGTLSSGVPETSPPRVQVHLLSAKTGQELLTMEEVLGPGRTSDTIRVLGRSVRAALSAHLTSEEEAILSQARAGSDAVARLYVEGLVRFRSFDYTIARSSFDAALGQNKDFTPARQRVLQSFEKQNERKKAEETVRVLLAGSALRWRDRQLLLAKQLELKDEPDKARERMTALLDSFPDDLELGLGLTLYSQIEPQGQSWYLALITRLMQLPPPASTDIRLVLAHGETLLITGKVDVARALFEEARARAEALGARSEQAWAIWDTAEIAWVHDRMGLEAAPLFANAAQVFETVGELELARTVRGRMATLYSNLGPRSRAAAALNKVAALDRKFGDRQTLGFHEVFLAREVLALGQLRRAGEILEQARREWDPEGEQPGNRNFSEYFQQRADLQLEQGDLRGALASLRAYRNTYNSEEKTALSLESTLLFQQDRLDEAAASARRAATLAAASGAALEEASRILWACRLDCEMGRPEAGLSCLSSTLASAGMGPAFVAHWFMVKSRCEYLLRTLTGAREDAEKAVTLFKEDENYIGETLARVQLMRADAALGRAKPAVPVLRAELAQAEGKGAKRLALEAALALGEAELRAGMAFGRKRLVALEREAGSLGFFRIARLAKEARESAASRTPHAGAGR